VNLKQTWTARYNWWFWHSFGDYSE